MPLFIFTKDSKKQLYKLDKATQGFILEKLHFLKQDDTFDHNCVSLKNMEPATHRVRIGQYRAVLECDFATQRHKIVDIKHRKDIYK